PFPQVEASADGGGFTAARWPSGADAAGMAVIWDLSAKEPSLTEVGVIARGPLTDQEKTPDLSSCVGDGVFAAKCAGDSIWLAASREPLLTRMREACERQSISMRDRRVARGTGAQAPQLFLSLNAAAGLGELLQSGIGAAADERAHEAKPAETAWQAAYHAA